MDESDNRDQFRTQRNEENPTTRVRELKTKNSPAEKQLQNEHAQGRAQFGAKKGPFGAANAQISAHRGRTLRVRRRNAKNTPRKAEMSLGTATVGSAAPWCPFWAPQRLQEVISGRAATVSGRAAHPFRNCRCSGTVYRRRATFGRRLPHSYSFPRQTGRVSWAPTPFVQRPILGVHAQRPHIGEPDKTTPPSTRIHGRMPIGDAARANPESNVTKHDEQHPKRHPP